MLQRRVTYLGAWLCEQLRCDLNIRLASLSCHCARPRSHPLAPWLLQGEANEGSLEVLVSPDFVQRYGGNSSGAGGGAGAGAGSSSGSARGGAGGGDEDSFGASQAGGGGFTQAAARAAASLSSMQEVATLSGGEKSVSTLHLLTSIAKHCNLPFRAHDEVRPASTPTLLCAIMMS